MTGLSGIRSPDWFREMPPNAHVEQTGSQRPALRVAKPVYAGVDWMRGLAAFAVVCAHTSFPVGAGVPMSRAAENVLLHSRFHVPFFLAAAFAFFAPEKSTLLAGITARARRLLIPFAFWTLVYGVLRGAKMVLSHRSPWPEDPLGWLFGGASVQLYFLPMLFAGVVLGFLIYPVIRRLPEWSLPPLLIGSIGGALALYQSHNGFDLTANQAFEHAFPHPSPVLRVVLAFLAWWIALLPYAVFGSWMRRGGLEALRDLRIPALLVFSVLFLGWLIFGYDILPEPLCSLSGGFIAFLFAASISFFIPPTNAARAVSRWSFGIYLAHIVPLQLLQMAAVKLLDGAVGEFTVPLLFFSALLIFSISAALCWAVERTRLVWLEQVFGLRA